MMHRKLDFLDVKILEGLGIYGPRNITGLAKKLSLHPETLRKRVKRLLPHVFLNTNVYHTNIGLKKAMVLVEAVPGYEDLLLNCLKVNEFWIYATKCYGRFEGCLAIYAIPKDFATQFEEFLDQLKAMGVARNTSRLWSTCWHTVNLTSKWFDTKSNSWIFQWDDWINEIPTMEIDLPSTLLEPKDFPQKADEIDILILKELERNAAVSLSKIAKMLGLTKQTLTYHYQEHILKNGLIEGFQIFSFPFDISVSDFFFFIFKFDSEEKMARFARSLMDKPFTYSIGRITGENAIMVHVFFPKLEFRRFIGSLSKLVQKDLLKYYEYVIQDFQTASGEIIPYQCFKNRTWIYDHQRYIRNLQDLVKSSMYS